jgi:hypothetical protein
VSVNQLPIISGPVTGVPPVKTNFAEPVFDQAAETAPYVDTNQTQSNNPKPTHTSSDEIINLIERLAKLRDAGALTEQDFNAKKMELLARI